MSMTGDLLRWGLFAIVVALPPSSFARALAAGSPVRYALVVGNNEGRTPPGVTLPPLLHAERESRRIGAALAQVGHFDRAGGRLIVLTGATREAILQAAARLAAKRRQDQRLFGKSPTLFALFFTGHGLAGQLLTGSAPLTGKDLARIFKRMSATFTVGVFDACYSGALNHETLRAKGLRSTPGFNAFKALPTEVLTAKGTMWFVSSRPDQVSYEDRKLGGLFSHFFMEGMRQAPKDGFGITVDAIWEYARRRTETYARRRGRRQTPQMMIRNLTSSGPVYLSFPAPRRSTLVLAPALAGRFIMRYAAGQLTETVLKRRGHALRVPVYGAPMLIEWIDPVGGRRRSRLDVKPGAVVRFAPRRSWRPQRLLGLSERRLSSKGFFGGEVIAAEETKSLSLTLDARYRTLFGPSYSAAPLHNAVVGLQFDYGLFSTGASFTFGAVRQTFDSWSYSLRRLGGAVYGGLGWALWRLRLGPTVGVGLSHREVDYGERSRGAVGLALFGGLNVSLRIYGRLMLVASAGLRGERSTPVAPEGASAGWEALPWVDLGLAALLF